MTYKIKDNTVAVALNDYWLPIDKDTPRNVKVQAISREHGGIAQYAEIRNDETWYDFWRPVPRFKDAVG